MDKENFDLLKECLKKLMANSIWVLSIFMIAIFAKIQGLEKVNLGQFSIDTKIAGWYFILICFVLTLAIIKNYNTCIGIFNKIDSDETKEIAKNYLNLYPSLLNPFAEQDSNIRSILFDNWGYTIISYFPFTSLIIGCLFVKIHSILSIVLFGLTFIGIIILRVEQRIVEKDTIRLICPKSLKVKQYIYYSCFIIGLIVMVLIQMNNK